MDPFLQEIKQICSLYKFKSLEPLIESAENLTAEKIIDLSIFGQFKAGKSSFINSLVGKSVLPTGVVPVTSVITRIIYGENEKTSIHFKNGNSADINLNDLGNYVTEIKNPENEKGVSTATVELPEMKPFIGLCFIDTPGMGSVFINNTRTTTERLATTSIAIVCISAERPLAEADVKLIRELNNNSYKLFCLLTKTDLFSKDQLEEITGFISHSLEKETGQNIPVFHYSIYTNTGLYRNNIIETICKPLSESSDIELGKIFRHKLLNIASACLNYVEIALKVSDKTDGERQGLKEKILDEKVKTAFIQHELNLISTDSKSKVRDTVYAILQPYSKEIVSGLQQEFQEQYLSWKGNLFKMSRMYEHWLRSALSIRLGNIVSAEQSGFDEILQQIGSHFAFYSKSLKERIYDRVNRVLGIQLSIPEWHPEFRPLKQPDISIYAAFDIPIDLLWFLFPMPFFRNVFRNYFRKQIRYETEKNIWRLTSTITEIINKETDNSKDQTLRYILDELNTIEKVLSGQQSHSDEFKKVAEKLHRQILNL